MADPMSLRLETIHRQHMELVAAVHGCSVSDVIRTAIAEYWVRLRNDPKFRDSVDEYLDRQRKVLLGHDQEDISYDH